MTLMPFRHMRYAAAASFRLAAGEKTLKIKNFTRLSPNDIAEPWRFTPEAHELPLSNARAKKSPARLSPPERRGARRNDLIISVATLTRRAMPPMALPDATVY